MALEKNLLCFVPVAILHGALEVGAVVAVQVLEDPVLVLQPPIHPLWWRIIHCRECALLRPRRGGGRGRKAGGSRGRGQRSVGGHAKRRWCGCVSCEHRECCAGVDWRN